MKKPKLQIQLDHIEYHAKRVVDPTTRDKALFVFGPTGIGKSLILKRVIGDHIQVQDATKVGVLDTLRANPTATILMDDYDDAWTDIPTLNVFKAALAEPDARVMHVNRQTLRSQTSETTFSGRIVIVSNTETEKLSPKFQPHLEALGSRATVIHLTRGPRDLLEFLDWRVCECDHFRSEQFFKDTGITSLGLPAAQDALDFVHEFAWRLPSISLRTLNQIAVERKLYKDGWHDRALALLRDKPIFDGKPPAAPVVQRWNDRMAGLSPRRANADQSPPAPQIVPWSLRQASRLDRSMTSFDPASLIIAAPAGQDSVAKLHIEPLVIPFRQSSN